MNEQNSLLEQHDVKKANRYAKFAYGVLALALITIAVVIHWENQTTPLTITNNPVQVDPASVDQSVRYVTLKTAYCKTSTLKGTIRSQLISDRTVLGLPPFEDRVEKGCGTVEFPYPVPPQAIKDTYHYHFVATYQVNPLKTVTTTWDSQPFVVSGAPN